jgi:hypothetical protein
MPEPLSTAPVTGVDPTEDQEQEETLVIAPDSNADLIPRSEVKNLEKALKAERESRKIAEKEAKERAAQLEKFKEINPEEYQRLQEEAAIAERERLAAEERTALLESKYGAQTAEANRRAEQAYIELQDYRKRYALEKVFFAAGGRTDAEGGVSFFDLLADRLSGHFRLDKATNTVVVVDSDGNPVLAGDTGKRVAPEDYLATFKEHPIFGTFFKGQRGSGAGLGVGGTGERGIATEDFGALSVEEQFERAFG